MLQMNLIEDFLDKKEKFDEAKKAFDNVKDVVKTAMIQSGQTSVVHNGSEITLSQSQRATVKRNKGDDLMKVLATAKQMSCYDIEYKINKQRLQDAEDANLIPAGTMNAYVTVSDVYTIRVK